MANEILKVNRYEVYMGDTGSIVFAKECFTFKNKLIFTNASGKEVAVFNWDEIKGYKLTEIIGL